MQTRKGYREIQVRNRVILYQSRGKWGSSEAPFGLYFTSCTKKSQWQWMPGACTGLEGAGKGIGAQWHLSRICSECEGRRVCIKVGSSNCYYSGSFLEVVEEEGVLAGTALGIRTGSGDEEVSAGWGKKKKKSIPVPGLGLQSHPMTCWQRGRETAGPKARLGERRGKTWGERSPLPLTFVEWCHPRNLCGPQPTTHFIWNRYFFICFLEI